MPKPHGRRGRKGERRPPVHRNVLAYRDAKDEAKREAEEYEVWKAARLGRGVNAEEAQAAKAKAKAAAAKAKTEAEAKAKTEVPDVDMDNTREELDTAAALAGVEDPAKLANKQAVLDAIAAATSGS